MGNSFGRGKHRVFLGVVSFSETTVFPVATSRISADGFQLSFTLLLPFPSMINVGLPFATAISLPSSEHAIVLTLYGPGCDDGPQNAGHSVLA